MYVNATWLRGVIKGVTKDAFPIVKSLLAGPFEGINQTFKRSCLVTIMTANIGLQIMTKFTTEEPP